MFYVWEISVPANTPEASAVREEIPVCHGVIHRVEIEFEKWCANLLHVRLYRFEQQIYPTHTGQSFASDGETVGFNAYFPVYETPYKLMVEAWNDDDFFDWTARVRIGMLPQFVAEQQFGQPSALDRQQLLEAFGLPAEEA